MRMVYPAATARSIHEAPLSRRQQPGHGLLERNWATLPVDPASIDYVLLTHGHLDHCGLLPRAVARGLNCSIITTEPSVDLARIIMEDSAEIQEEDAAYKRKRHEREGRKGPHPVEPRYTLADAELAAKLLEGVRYNEPFELSDRVTVTFREAGHILGSAILDIVCRNGSSENRIVFSGDLGQWDKPLIGDPQFVERADYVVMESTYGDRNPCDEGTPEDQLAAGAARTPGSGGNLVIGGAGTGDGVLLRPARPRRSAAEGADFSRQPDGGGRDRGVPQASRVPRCAGAGAV